MRNKFILASVFILCISISISMYNWINAPVSAVRNQCSVEDLVDDMDALNEAISKMGPYYNYIISPEGDLFVNKGDGKWLKLRYRKGETK
jgi:hypothetical protein